MEFTGLTSASHMSLPEAGYGSEEGYVGSEISGAVSGLRPLGHQGYRLLNHKKDPPLCSGYMVAEEIMTLLLESPRTPLDHRTLAGLSLVLSHCVFPLRLHSPHLPSEPRIMLLSVLTVAIDIGLEFILVLIVV